MTTMGSPPDHFLAARARASARLDADDFATGLWSHDLDVWKLDADARASIANRLGWLHALDFIEPHLPRLRAFADSVRHDAITDVVLLGMGGSSLAPEVLRQVIGVAAGFPRFRILDSVDPDAVRDALEPAGTSLFIVASKSGSTIEPTVMAAEARRRVIGRGQTTWASHFVAITDDGSPLHREALDEGFRDVFVNPGDVGGRYSALSFFGLVPAALMGLDLDRMVSAARVMADACRSTTADNPGLALGTFLAAGAAVGRDKLTLLVPASLQAFGLWVEQLVAESTGKSGKGIVPVTGEPAGVRFGDDRLVVSVTLGNEGPAPEMLEEARATGAPTLSLEMPDTLSIGAEFFRWEVATATAGFLLGVNPFDEPDVTRAKTATREFLDGYIRQGHWPMPSADDSIEGATLTLSAAARQQLAGRSARNLLRLAKPSDYVALLAYLPPDVEPFPGVLRAMRLQITARTGCATMFGYGPRYLHSTGQLHKGGANTGVFIIVTADVGEDLAIPGEPFSFGALELAQALGDFASLDRTGRRAMHLHLPRRDADLLRHVAAELMAD